MTTTEHRELVHSQADPGGAGAEAGPDAVAPLVSLDWVQVSPLEAPPCRHTEHYEGFRWTAPTATGGQNAAARPLDLVDPERPGVRTAVARASSG